MAGRIASHRPVAELTIDDKGYIGSHRPVVELTIDDKAYIGSHRPVAELTIDDKAFVSSHYVVAELTDIPFGQISSFMVVVEVVPDQLPESIDGSLKPIRDATLALVLAASSSQSNFIDLIDAGTYTDKDIESFNSFANSHLNDIEDIRSSLDPKNVTDYVIAERGDAYLAVWEWEKQTRFALSVVARKLIDAKNAASELKTGKASLLYVTKRGDTLQSIAAKFLGSWQSWSIIADANGIEPGIIEPGTTLIIPEKA